MADYTNKGVIFKNNYKEKDNQPEYKGKINVDGVEKEIALFVNVDKNGKKYFGAVISEPYIKPEAGNQEHEGARPSAKEPIETSDEPTDNLPF